MCDIVALEVLPKCDGNNNTGGMSALLYIGLAQEVATDITYAAVPTTGAERITAATTHIMATGKRFWTVATEHERVKLKIAPIGNRGSQGYEITLEAFIPGLVAANLGWGNNLKNADVIVIVSDPDNANSSLVIGSKLRPAQITVEYNAEGQIGGEKGGLIKVIARSASVPAVFPTSLTIDVTGA